MSGQRATDHTRWGDGVSTRSRTVRAAAVITSVFALAVCGAVAQASSDPGDATTGGAPKWIDAPKAGPVPTSAPPTSEAQPPDNLGDDSELEALAQSCFAGDIVACDHLYLQSPIDSTYESYGDTWRTP